MGHREDLLEGAKRCLLEKGWVGTTARDIVSASGANLASIGYHYGSKEALLAEAFFALTEEWGAATDDQLRAKVPQNGDRVDRLTASLDAVTASFTEHQRFWRVQLEVLGQLGRHPELRKKMSDVQPQGREGVLAMFEGVEDGAFDATTVRTAGSFYYALFIGLWIQWAIDPEKAPSGRELTDGMRRVISGALDKADGEGAGE